MSVMRRNKCVATSPRLARGLTRRSPHRSPPPLGATRLAAESTASIEARLAEHGLERTGEIDQPHVRWWSTVLRVPTADGDLWFKANAAPHAFEARLLAILERVRPGHVPELVAHDSNRGWLLMRDGGERLREPSFATLGRWERILPEYAEFQRTLTPHPNELLAAGVPDERLAVLPALFDALLDDRELCVDQPDGQLSEEEYEASARSPGLGRELRATRRLRNPGDDPARRPPRRELLRLRRPVPVLRLGRQLRSHPFHRSSSPCATSGTG